MRQIVATFIGWSVLASPLPTLAEQLRFAADDWLTECASVLPAVDCSLTAVFRGLDSRGATGSFAMVIGLENLLAAIVGQPFPAKATLRVDKFPPIDCVGRRHCLFANDDSAKLIGELAVGNLLLVDVYAGTHDFRASLSIKGYQAGIAKIRAVSQQ